MARIRDRAWLESPLFDVGYDEITIEFTAHLKGATDEVHVGLHVYHTPTREDLVIEAFPFHGSLHERAALAEWMTQTLRAVHRYLLPST